MSKDFEKVQVLAQEFAGVVPSVILGSGASCAHGMPGMYDLQSHLTDTLQPAPTLRATWESIVEQMDSVGLEAALTNVSPPEELTKLIVDATWRYLHAKDKKIRRDLVVADEDMPLSKLLTYLLATTHKEIDIITTNYDQLAELAAEQAGLFIQTGFFPGEFSRRNSGEPLALYSGRSRVPAANIWKVHGSLNWFEDVNQLQLQTSFDPPAPDGYAPLIVTPGVAKLQRTQFEPFRTIMTNADTALTGARGFLCIGFGFRDKHIEPKIIERFRKEQVPMIALAYELTPENKDFLNKHSEHYLAIEKSPDGSRCFFSGGGEDGIELSQEDLWTVTGFLSLVR